MSLLAAVRPDEWNLPLFLHVLGAMVLVGGLLLASTVLLSAWRSGSVPLTRTGYRTMLIAVLPSWLVTRVTSQWIADEEGYKGDDDPAWIVIGYITTEPGLLLIVGATVAAGLAVRRANREGRPAGTGARVAAVLASLMLVVYVFAVWAMTTKPA